MELLYKCIFVLFDGLYGNYENETPKSTLSYIGISFAFQITFH